MALKPFANTHAVTPIRFGQALKPGLDKKYEALADIKSGEHLNIKITILPSEVMELQSSLIGEFNGMNITAAALMAHALGVKVDDIAKAVAEFKGIWRRMEFLSSINGALVYSDYGHHPTAVASTLKSLRQAFPNRRVVLCFQPHHKNRTKHLFNEFTSCFDQADVLILCEIYDVAGRSADEDADVTSQKLLDAVKAQTNERPLKQMEYAPDPDSAVKRTLELLQPNDVCVIMGAGDIDASVRKLINYA